jgi:hypothetical protein
LSGSQNGWNWLSGTHDGYDRLGSRHYRWLGVKAGRVVILDLLKSDPLLPYSSHFHLAPELELKRVNGGYCLVLDQGEVLISLLGLNSADKAEWLSAETSKAYYAPEMGKQIPRGSLRLSGQVQGNKALCAIFSLEPISSRFSWQAQAGSLQLNTEILNWELGSRGLALRQK